MRQSIKMGSKQTMAQKTNISILGCGWYGQALAKALITAGHSVKGSTTSPQKLNALAAEGIEPYLVSFSPDNEQYDDAFFTCDVLFICIPPKSRGGEGPEFINKIQGIIKAIKKYGVQNVVFISSTGVYADINAEVNELSDPQPNTEAGRILWQAEELLRKESTFKTTIIRFAGLIGPGRDPGRFFAGKKAIANGNAPVNLIHLDDCIGLSMAIIDRQAFGYLFNGCSPHHPSRSAFYTGSSIRSGLEAPEFIDELKEWKIVKSVNVEETLGYKYTMDQLGQSVL